MSIPTEPVTLPAAPAGGVVVDMTPGGGKVPPCNDGLYKATLAQVGTIKSAFAGQPDATVLRFVLDGQDAERDGTLNIVPSRTDKGRFPWSTVLTALKVSFKPGEKQTLAASDLIGRPVSLLVANEPGKKDPSRMFPRIKALVAA